MATSFQPEDPHSKARTTTSGTSIVVTAVIGALMVVMLFAVVAPRLFGEVGWPITIGAGILTLLIVLAVGFMRRSGGRAENPSADEGVEDRPSSTSATP